MSEIVPNNSSIFMPALSIAQAIERRNIIVEATRALLIESVDFGKIPGTPKPTLLKPGAEKLCSIFGLSPNFSIVEKETDWTGEAHGGEPLFYFSYRCQLTRSGVVVGEGEGSCNSWEKKYRFRNADRACPACGSFAIKRSKFPPRNNPKAEPGWYCHDKAGGCGAQFDAADPAIVGQQAGRQANPDIFDVVNTISKMAQKRAFIAAILIATNASEFFTQDVEDMQVIDVEAHAAPARPQIADEGASYQPTPAQERQQPAQQPRQPAQRAPARPAAPQHPAAAQQPRQPAQQALATDDPRKAQSATLRQLRSEARALGVAIVALGEDPSADELASVIDLQRAAIEAEKERIEARQQRAAGQRLDDLDSEYDAIDAAAAAK